MSDSLPCNLSPKEGIKALINSVSDELLQVNQQIINRMQSHVPLIGELAGHLISSGGKRMRPVLTLASAKLCGDDFSNTRAVGLAACVEFIHTATLLHDDVVDESMQRRGHDTANFIWGNQASVLVGDFLFSRAFELMVEDDCLEILRILSSASAVIAQGEVAQLQTASDLSTRFEDYMKVIEGKTAALFAAACEVGAVVTNQAKPIQNNLRLYGLNLGLAFQIADDILDWSATQEALGKNIGDDFREGKVTLPIIFAYDAATDEEKQFWSRCIENMDQKEGDLEKATQLIHKYKCLEKSLDIAKELAQKAADSLSIFEDSSLKDALIASAFYAVDREF